MKKTILLSVLLLSISAIICTTILVEPSILFRQEGTIKVKGFSEQTVESDIAKWSASIKAIDANAQNAYAKIQASKAQILDFLKAYNISESDIESSLAFEEIYQKDHNGYTTKNIDTYEYRLFISYDSVDIDLIEKLSKDCFDLVNKGLEISPNSPSYLFQKLESLKLDLMASASENAKERAKILVSGSGSKLGKVVLASQGVFQITSPLSTSTSSYGMYDTSSREKRITCVVTVEYAVD